MNYRLACITGATSGIGEALAHALAREGVPLLLTGRNEKALQALADTLSAKTLPCDLSDPAQRKTLIDQIKTHGADLIINNAGLGYMGDALSHPTADHLYVLRVNCEALLEITLETARHLQQTNRPGTILNVSSIAAFFSLPFHAVYGASKAFVNSFSLALDTELKPHNIRVLTACPGVVSTNFRKRCTKGKAPHHTTKAMTPETAARAILHQIHSQKRLTIFNTRSRLTTYLARLLPSSLLYRTLKRRFPKL